MNTMKYNGLVAAILIGATGSTLLADDPDKPVQEPAVPTALVGQGIVYHTLAGREAQVTFTSKAPLENIVGKSNAVVGYVVAGPVDSPADLVGAQWLLPVDSLATGLPLRDAHIADHEWLDSQSFPVISFKLTNVEEVTEVKSGDGFSTWSLTLVGEMTMHGETKTIRVKNARLSFINASEKTKKIAKGDLCFLKCEYRVRMSDFGIRHKDVPNKVSDEIVLRQMLRMSTIRQGD